MKPVKPITIGKLMFERIVPQDFRTVAEGEDEALTSNRVGDILEQIAHKDPDRYRQISHQLLKLGAKGSVETNTSFKLDDLKSPIEKAEVLKKIDASLARIDQSNATPEQKEEKRLKLYNDWGQRLPDQVFAEAMKRDSGLARMVAAGARGSKGQLNSNIGADMAVSDSTGRQIPVPILNNYSEGLSPAEYFAASYGTRLGLVATKFAVQDSGYFAKQLSAAAADLIITEDDCGTGEGLPVKVGDKDNIGALLAEDAGGFGAGTVITPKVARQISSNVGDKRISVRSPISCSAKGGGICSKCAGIREQNQFLEIGDNVGLTASNGVSEPVSQALLSTKHTAGVASAGGSGQVRGFPQIDSLAQVPKTFPFAATLSEIDGRVAKVEDAPQGGRFVTVGDQRHYIPADRDVQVKVGQEVEAGDMLSSGTPNPKEIVRHKGVGAGRAYFVQAMTKALGDNRTTADRRNLEVLSRALINHVKVGDDVTSGEFLPDDIVEYSAMAESYRPAGDTKKLNVGKARGMFLQKPTLHYSVGTRITPSVEKDLLELGRKEIEVSETKPTFEAQMVRMADNPAYKDDFMTHTGQSQVKRNLGRDIQSGGAESLTHGKYFAPALARGTEFGRPGEGQVGY